MCFIYMRLHRYEPRDRIEAWKVWLEIRQRRIIRNVQNLFSDSDFAEPGKLVVRNGADPTPRTTWKHGRRFLNDISEGKDIISFSVVL